MALTVGRRSCKSRIQNQMFPKLRWWSAQMLICLGRKRNCSQEKNFESKKRLRKKSDASKENAKLKCTVNFASALVARRNAPGHSHMPRRRNKAIDLLAVTSWREPRDCTQRRTRRVAAMVLRSVRSPRCKHTPGREVEAPLESKFFIYGVGQGKF